MRIRFMSLGSGSSGNCYFLGTEQNSILIDAGIGIRTIKKILKEKGLSLEQVRAVFVTHDHADHIKAVGHLGEKQNIPIYSTPAVHAGIRRSYCMTQKLSAAHIRYVEKERPVELGEFQVTCFEVPHDGSDNVGYSINVDGKNFTFITDIGHITPTAARYIAQANYLVLESNYDKTMLEMGPYPRHLKDRIAGPNGHLCNQEAAQFIAENFPAGLKYLFLCHLSKDNNHPELAYKTVEIALQQQRIQVGKDVQLIALRRSLPSEVYEF